MNFIEAVKSLQNGECEGIRRSGCSQEYSLGPNSFLKYADCLKEFDITNTAWFLAEDWILVNPKPVTEHCVVKAWKWNYGKAPKPHGCPEFTHIDPTAETANSWIPLIGTYEREIPRKVRKKLTGEVTWKSDIGHLYPTGVCFPWEKIIGKTGTLTFEFEE